VPRLTEFVARLIKDEFNFHLDFDEELDFEEWLASTNYPEWRKNELRKAKEEITFIEDPKNFMVKVFMKDESYPEFKHSRGIYARADAAKVIFGPLIKKFENLVYKHPAFIKHVPVKDRPDYIKSRLFRSGANYVAADWTSFEGHLRPDIYDAIERQFYEHFIGACGFQKYILDIFSRVISGVNHLENKYFYAQCLARRMSGEMNTSLGNGLMNYAMIKFVAHVNDVALDLGVVEGDDSLFSCVGRLPTREMFLEAGCLVKVETFPDISTAGFCGNIFHPDVGDILTDPIKALCNAGWGNVKYLNSRKSKKMALMRAKALSMLYQYPGCPIVSAYAKRMLYLTRSVDIRCVLDSFDSYHRHIIDEAMNANLGALLAHPIADLSRDLMSDHFGITVSEQLKIESDISVMTDNLYSETLISIAPEVKFRFWDDYIEPRDMGCFL
jgi:hypothetical protein